jgi:hypothetical protein
MVKIGGLSVEPGVTQRLVAAIVIPIVFGPWDTQIYIAFIKFCSTWYFDMVLVSMTPVHLLFPINIGSIIGCDVL